MITFYFNSIGDALRLEHSLPAGDVATGLAWAYVINYLVITLLGKSSESTGCLGEPLTSC